jgi:hypothetical protein
MSEQWNVIDYGSYTITNTAGNLFSFADSNFPDSKPTGAKSFVGILETAAIRIRGDGTNPTTAEGTLVNPSQIMALSESEFDGGLGLVRTGATSAVLKGHFYDVTADVVSGKVSG